jgi:hypothetical protein
VFRAVASATSGSGGSHNLPDIIAEVSISSPEGVLVDRKKFDDAATLLVRSRLVEPGGDGLRLTPEGGHFWQRISHLQASGMKKWIREAVDSYSKGAEVRWAIPDDAWSDAQVLFGELHRSRMTARLEVLDGLLTAIENWHFVSSLIGAAADRYAAVAVLQGFPFFFSKVQAVHVLDMRLAQRTALGRLSLAEERDAIRSELEELNLFEMPGASAATPEAGDGPEAQDPGVQDRDHLAELGDASRFTASG